MGVPTIANDYAACLEKLHTIDPSRCEAASGVQSDVRTLLIPFYEKTYRVSQDQIIDLDGEKPTDAIGLVLCRYLLNCPSQTLPIGRRITFRELKGAGPLVSSFANNTNKLITGAFATNPNGLELAGRRLNGQKQDRRSGFDLVMTFYALPRVRLYLQFNAADESFPAQCGILFDQSAENLLDMQSLFFLGTYLAGGLVRHTSSGLIRTTPYSDNSG